MLLHSAGCQAALKLSNTKFSTQWNPGRCLPSTIETLVPIPFLAKSNQNRCHSPCALSTNLSYHLLKPKSFNAEKINLHPLDIFGLASLRLHSRPKIRFFFNCIHFIRPSIVWNLWFRSIVHKVSRKTSTTITSGNESIHSWLIIRSEETKLKRN